MDVFDAIRTRRSIRKFKPWDVIAFVPVGVPDYDPPSRPRKPLEEVLEFVK